MLEIIIRRLITLVLFVIYFAIASVVPGFTILKIIVLIAFIIAAIKLRYKSLS